MKEIYRVTIHGRVLESRDLRKLMSEAVEEKRNMDRNFRYLRPASSSGRNDCVSVSRNQPKRQRAVQVM